MDYEVREGDLLRLEVEAIVNAWNRNLLPWWLLYPQGVSGAIKREAGLAPFRELGRMGAIPLGGAVITGAGRLPFRAIVHVAGIDALWRASERSIRSSVRNALTLAAAHGLTSVGLPLIGTGSGGFDEQTALSLIVDELAKLTLSGRAVVVRLPRKRG